MSPPLIWFCLESSTVTHLWPRDTKTFDSSTSITTVPRGIPVSPEKSLGAMGAMGYSSPFPSLLIHIQTYFTIPYHTDGAPLWPVVLLAVCLLIQLEGTALIRMFPSMQYTNPNGSWWNPWILRKLKLEAESPRISAVWQYLGFSPGFGST